MRSGKKEGRHATLHALPDRGAVARPSAVAAPVAANSAPAEPGGAAPTTNAIAMESGDPGDMWQPVQWLGFGRCFPSQLPFPPERPVRRRANPREQWLRVLVRAP